MNCGVMVLAMIGCLGGVVVAQTTQPTTHTFAAVSYFDTSCARCHGDGGAMLTKKQTTLPAEKMRQRVAEMARGPAMAPLENDAQVAAVAAYVSSMGSGEPFAVVTTRKPDMLEGEAGAGTSVFVEVNGERLPAKAEGHKWRAQDVQGWGRIVAVKGKAEIVVAEAGK